MENVFVLVEWEDGKDPCTLGVFKTLDASEVSADKSERGPWFPWRTSGHANGRERYAKVYPFVNQSIEMYEVQA